jgi:uncharacterized protein (TIGR03792 family)
VATSGFRYVAGERLPVEVLVFEVEPGHLDEFLRVDHEVWTLGEALLPDLDRIPFLSKEVWLDDSRPGRITLVFVWESMERVGDAEVQPYWSGKRCAGAHLPGPERNLRPPSSWTGPDDRQAARARKLRSRS